jgi:cell cycle sensor histidine kinase DivJ
LSWFLSRTGRYEGAHVLSSLALAGLIMAVAITTGGIESFAAMWLIVVPLEAALSASRRVAAFASLLALSCAGRPDPSSASSAGCRWRRRVRAA